jgi:hypothetical protein
MNFSKKQTAFASTSTILFYTLIIQINPTWISRWESIIIIILFYFLFYALGWSIGIGQDFAVQVR